MSEQSAPQSQSNAGSHGNAGSRGTVLLVDDDLGDQELTRRAFRHESLEGVQLLSVDDGEQALDYLHRRGHFTNPQDSPRPDLILLDLNMPRKNGSEVLEAIKGDKDFAGIPVVMLTTSQQEIDIARSYQLGCSSYIQKPVDLCQFTQAVRQIGLYWFNIVALPSRLASHTA
ncbi:MAG: response regulator [Planctomycetota bacterium]